MANVPTVAHNEGTPAGTDYIRDGDNRIREWKTQVREIIAVDHKMDSSGQGATWGMHKQITLIETADIGSGATGLPILGAQTVGAEPELVYTDEGDTDIQLTKVGKSYANLIADEAEMDSDAAPTTDVMVVNKKYVDDQVSVAGMRISGWADFDGDGTLQNSYNIDSIVRNAQGKYTVTWTTDFADTNYAVVAICGTGVQKTFHAETKNVGTCVLYCTDEANNFYDSGAGSSLIAIGDQ